MKKIRIVPLMLLLLFILTACGTKEKDAALKSTKTTVPKEISSAQEENWFLGLDTTDMAGNPVTSELFQGKKLTLINTWATFCGPCINEMPELEELWQEYKDEDLVGIVGLLIDSSSMKFQAGLSEEEQEKGRDIIETTGVTYPQILVSETLAETGLRMIGIFPTTYFVDEDGNFVGPPLEGARNKEKWKQVIEERLAMLE